MTKLFPPCNLHCFFFLQTTTLLNNKQHGKLLVLKCILKLFKTYTLKTCTVKKSNNRFTIQQYASINNKAGAYFRTCMLNMCESLLSVVSETVGLNRARWQLHIMHNKDFVFVTFIYS